MPGKFVYALPASPQQAISPRELLNRFEGKAGDGAILTTFRGNLYDYTNDDPSDMSWIDVISRENIPLDELPQGFATWYQVSRMPFILISPAKVIQEGNQQIAYQQGILLPPSIQPTPQAIKVPEAIRQPEAVKIAQPEAIKQAMPEPIKVPEAIQIPNMIQLQEPMPIQQPEAMRQPEATSIQQPEAMRIPMPTPQLLSIPIQQQVSEPTNIYQKTPIPTPQYNYQRSAMPYSAWMPAGIYNLLQNSEAENLMKIRIPASGRIPLEVPPMEVPI